MNTVDKNKSEHQDVNAEKEQFDQSKKSAKPGYLGNNNSSKDHNRENQYTEKDKDKQSQPGRKEIHRDGGQRK